MTVSYSLDVAKARFCGFAQLLGRWKGGVYKVIWREFLIFCLAYAILSFTYRCYLDEEQKITFEKVVLFVETCTDLIPLSFVLGFYVSLVIGRWWGQYETVPWPDRLALTISCYVDGNDERSRMIRRTLARYVILTKVLTFQAVSTSVKRRFPTTQHLVAAGIMTPAEKCVYEKISFPYGKWWLPLHWFTALATRAKREGRIKDTVLLNGLFKEILDFRTSCAIMFGYDWISVPLVYTQVVTIATYAYSLALIVGRQYLDPMKGYPNHNIDLYVPFFTMLQFFFYIGWLKVAEQILNPYGEDDDDFELNWCLDRAVHLSYISVDHIRMKHPKVEKDYFYDETNPTLPQTKDSALFGIPQLGSAFYLNVDEAEYLPVDALFEEDEEAHIYSSNSVKRSRENSRKSILKRILSSGFGQSQRKKSTRRTYKNQISVEGHVNRGFDENTSKKNNIAEAETTTLNNSIKKTRTLSSSFHPNHKSYNLTEIEKSLYKSDKLEQTSDVTGIPVTRTTSAPIITNFSKLSESDKQMEKCLESDPEPDSFMPDIPEESSRAASLANIGVTTLSKNDEPAIQRLDAVQNLVEDANRMLLELRRSISIEKEPVIGTENCEVEEGSDENKNNDSEMLKESEISSDDNVNSKITVEVEKHQK